jgi:catechol 2,3-dioxygenase-like lactoylglutathione lyase family enzyme
MNCSNNYSGKLPMKKQLIQLLSLFILTILIFTSVNINNQTVSQNLPNQNNAVAQNQAASYLSNVREVESVGMTVEDMDKAIAFYSEVLSFQKISDTEAWGSEYEHLQGLFGMRMRVVKMQLGEEILELTEYLTPKGRPIPVDSRSNDLSFQHIAIVVSDMNKAYQHLRKHQVQHVSTAPQRLPEYLTAAAGIEAFYFRDPDGHNLEIIYFPNGKGDPRWQSPTEKLFLGIDHTAIAIANTPPSLGFYQDLLGLQLKGESENYGTEQEHLNNVFGARLHISSLKAPTGIGIEFLEYLTPRDGNPFPADERANDLVHWQTSMIVEDAETVAQHLETQDYNLVSSGVITTSDRKLGFHQGFLVRDPDGHVLRIIEK